MTGEYIESVGEPNGEEFLTCQVEQNDSYIRNANTFSGTGKASQIDVSLRGLTGTEADVTFGIRNAFDAVEHSRRSRMSTARKRWN